MYWVSGSILGLVLNGSRAFVMLSHFGSTSGNFSVVCMCEENRFTVVAMEV